MGKTAVMSIALLLAGTLAVAYGSGNDGARPGAGRDAETKERIREWRRQTGGYVRQEDPGNGLVAIASRQSRVGKKALSGVAKYFSGFTSSMPFAVFEGNAPANATYVVEVKDEPGGGHRMTVWPEERRAEINVAEIAKDGVDAAKTEARVLKEVSRAIAYLVGGGSQYPGTLAGSDGRDESLDKFTGFEMPPDVFMRVVANLRAADVRPVRRVTYREAVGEGWAPAPTNDVQRAIWNEVHQIPDKPLKIEFDPKKDK